MYKRGPYKKRSLEDRFWEKVSVRGPDDCWLWKASLHTGGYGQIGIGYKPEKAHRASWIINVGPIPDGMEVLHKCDNPPCVNPRHLFLGTQPDNIRDMDSKKRRGTGVKPQNGEMNDMAKLTEDDVRYIRSLWDLNKTVSEIASWFPKISESNIRMIVSKRTWKHVK